MLYTKLSHKLITFFSPLKTLAFLLLILSIVNHLYNPFMHGASGDTLQEFTARLIFMFCGLFGIMGNGKTLRIRALVIGFPFIYLAVIYLLKLISTGIQTITIPLTVFSILGLWVIFLGAEYERRINSAHRSSVNSNNS